MLVNGTLQVAPVKERVTDSNEAEKVGAINDDAPTVTRVKTHPVVGSSKRPETIKYSRFADCSRTIHYDKISILIRRYSNHLEIYLPSFSWRR
jgi:hypothetical protein